jgi:hypothetical protein
MESNMDLDDSYVVRIFRRQPRGRKTGKKDSLSGVVETVAGGERTPFHDIEELWAVLRRKRVKPATRGCRVE